MELATETANEPTRAGTKPLTEKPSTKVAISQKIPALTTKEDSPKVTRCIGSVKSVRMGLIVILDKPKRIAAISAK